MEQHRHTNGHLMGKHYHGTNPCIDPLSMAELMLRLDERRRRNPATLQPGKPFARMLRILANLFR